MKRYLIIFTLSLLSLQLSAQEMSYTINGKVIGKEFKYAYLSYWELKPIEKMPIVNRKFSFSGTFKPENSSGAPTRARIMLSDADTITYKDGQFSVDARGRMVILADHIDIIYDADSDQFIVNGGRMNDIENIFTDSEEEFRKKELHAAMLIEQDTADSKPKRLKASGNALFREQMTERFQLIRKYPDSEVSLSKLLIFAMVPMKPVGESKALLNLFPEHLRMTRQGRLIDSLLTLQENMMKGSLAVGQMMPPFELADAGDKVIKSTAVLGKYTLIDFWASWCAPCRVETPNLKLAYEKYHQKGFNVIAISIDDDKGKWLTALSKDGMELFTNLHNPDSGSYGIAKQLNVNAIPANYLIDATGRIIAVNLRGENTMKKLAELFGD